MDLKAPSVEVHEKNLAIRKIQKTLQCFGQADSTTIIILSIGTRIGSRVRVDFIARERKLFIPLDTYYLAECSVS